MYKLLYQSTSVLRLTDNAVIPANNVNKDYQEYLVWITLGNTAQSADQPTAEQLAKEIELTQAPITAKEYFLSKPAAIAFVRSTPAEQDIQISGMSVAQKDTLLKYLAVACSALIKQQYL